MHQYSQARPIESDRQPSLWTTLRLPNFRNVFIADLLSEDTGTFMQSVGAAWLLVSLVPARRFSVSCLDGQRLYDRFNQRDEYDPAAASRASGKLQFRCDCPATCRHNTLQSPRLSITSSDIDNPSQSCAVVVGE